MSLSKRIELPGGCYFTGKPGDPIKGIAPSLTVNPKNWNSKVASVKKPWYIGYRFHDPLHRQKYPNGKLILVRGMNEEKTWEKRKLATEVLMQIELDNLMVNGYNPITGKSTPIEQPDGDPTDIMPYTPLKLALRKALDLMKCGKSTKDDIASMLKYIDEAIIRLKYTNLQVGDVTRRNIVKILDNCGRNKAKWSAHTFNKYRSYLMSLFRIIVRLEAIGGNPVNDIEKEATIRRIRTVLTPEERKRVNDHLKVNYYRFWRYMQIFFHSGSRTTELLSLKIKDVDLKRQQYKVLIKKGKSYKEVLKTIKNVALPYWQEVLSDFSNGDGVNGESYVFHKDLRPGGKAPIRPEQITRRWEVHVKQKLKIYVDFYSLKHLNTTEVVSMLSEEDAARLNAHEGTSMVRNVYDVGRSDRQHERLKRVGNAFA